MGYTLQQLEAMIGKKRTDEVIKDLIVKQEKKNKYGAEKVGEFDSKKEKGRYGELLLLEKAGKISGLQRQVTFILQEGFECNGEKIRDIRYIADFVYAKDGKKICEDVKGGEATKTQVFNIKKKMFLKRYGKDYLFIET